MNQKTNRLDDDYVLDNMKKAHRIFMETPHQYPNSNSKPGGRPSIFTA